MIDCIPNGIASEINPEKMAYMYKYLTLVFSNPINLNISDRGVSLFTLSLKYKSFTFCNYNKITKLEFTYLYFEIR